MGKRKCREMGAEREWKLRTKGNTWWKKSLYTQVIFYSKPSVEILQIFFFILLSTTQSKQSKRVVTMHQIMEYFWRNNLVTILWVSCNEDTKACSWWAVTSIDELQYRLAKLSAVSISRMIYSNSYSRKF